MNKFLMILLSLSGVLFGALENYHVATWNLQGSSGFIQTKWNVSVRQLVSGKGAVDILMIQEAGVLPPTAVQTERVIRSMGAGIPIHEYVWNLGTASKPSSVFVYYSRANVGANRVNLAIVSRVRADEVIVISPPMKLSRPIIGIRIGNDAFFSAHALASGGGDAADIVQAIHDFFINMPQIDWMIAGDFNREPAELMRALNDYVRSRVRLVAPYVSTQASGKVLDYAVTGNSAQGQPYTAPALLALLMLSNIRSHITSDHFPVEFRRFSRS